MTFPFVDENRVSRQRLSSLVRGLSDGDLGLSTSYGWTVAALLAHLAWWDQRALILLRRWADKGVDESPVDSQAVNDALRPLCHAIEPRAAVSLCLSSAEALDAELEAITQDLVEKIMATPNQFRFSRAKHRNEHLDDIELLLAEQKAPGGTG